jgi:Flp pilus assembly protein TadG
MPVAVLVFLVFGALCVDFGSTFSSKRELSNAAAGAANDVASKALDLDQFYESGEIVLRADLARRVAERSVAAMGSSDWIRRSRTSGSRLTGGR